MPYQKIRANSTSAIKNAIAPLGKKFFGPESSIIAGFKVCKNIRGKT
jgi:hypothetical protein